MSRSPAQASPTEVPLPVKSHLPSFDGATGWLNSPPLTPEALRGKVVLVDFWTYTCINWLRTLGYIRAWAAAYERHGLVVVGVHTPEFPFEEDVDNVRRAVADLAVRYPVALDTNYAVWNAFANRYWPAAYVADAQGRIRYHQFGEGGYEECEKVIQTLLREAGAEVGDELVTVANEGVEAQADWAHLQSPETYLGYLQGERFASSGAETDVPREYVLPEPLQLNQWGLSGGWTIQRRDSLVNQAGGRLAFRYHARDVNLVMGPREAGSAVPFRVTVDGNPPGPARGLDVDEQGAGAVTQPRLYQLVRGPGAHTDRTFEITFEEGGVETYVFTFG